MVCFPGFIAKLARQMLIEQHIALCVSLVKRAGDSMFVIQAHMSYKMADAVYIYAFRDLDSQEVRYIGMTRDLNRRCNQHVSGNSLVSKWIKELWRQGKNILIEILQIVPASFALEAEKKQIAIFYGQGHRLWNKQHIAPLEKQRRAAEEKAQSDAQLEKILEMIASLGSGGPLRNNIGNSGERNAP